MTAALDEIRAEIVARRDKAADEAHVARHQFDLAEAELEAHDRAVAAMNGAGARRNIAALVLAQLKADPHQTAEQLAAAIDARPAQVKDALARLQADHKIDDSGHGWVRVRGLDI